MEHRIAKPYDEMEWGKGRQSKLAAKISLLLSGDDGMVQTALIAPLLASIAMEFPQATELQLDRVMSITATMMIVAMIFASRLAYYFDKKKLIMIGTLIFACAGVAGELTTTIEQLTVTRAILGIGAGMAFPLVPSTIAYLFNEKEKNQMLGWMNSVGAIFSLSLSAIAGVIALFYWRHAFLFYLMFPIVTIIQLFCLPNFKPERIEKQEAAQRKLAESGIADSAEAEASVKEKLGWKPWFVGLCMLCFMIVAMVATFKISLFVEFNGLGTAANSGLCVTTMTGTSFVISLFFEKYFRTLKRFSSVVSLLFLAAAFGVLCLANSFIMCIIGMGLLGLCMGTLNPFFFSEMSHVAPKTRATLCMSMACIFQLGGQIITPYYMMGVAALGFADERSLFGFTSVLILAIAVVVFVVMLRKKNSDFMGEEEDAA